MCGIVAYIGNKNCKNILIEGLKRLEYRGYDSAGIGILTLSDEKKGIDVKNNTSDSDAAINPADKNRKAGYCIKVIKEAGKIKALEELLKDEQYRWDSGDWPH